MDRRINARGRGGVVSLVVPPLILTIACYNLAMGRGQNMWLDKVNTMADDQHNRDKKSAGAQGLNAMDAYDATTPVTKPGEYEMIPIGLHNPASDKDHASFNVVHENDTVGPFHLTAEQFREFKKTHSSQKLDELVERHALRASTALCIKSGQFDNIVNLLEQGQKPSPDLVQRFLPGDLQRVIEAERRGNR